MTHHSVITRHDSAEATSVGQGIASTFQVLAMTNGNTWTRETPLDKFS